MLRALSIPHAEFQVPLIESQKEKIIKCRARFYIEISLEVSELRLRPKFIFYFEPQAIDWD